MVVITQPISGSFCLVPLVSIVVPETIQRLGVAIFSDSIAMAILREDRFDLIRTPLTQKYRLEECPTANPDVRKQVEKHQW